ncbi:DUF445 domain-containing protein [Sorlinia euscelidii]
MPIIIQSDQNAANAYRKMRRVATSMLVVMGGVGVASTVLPMMHVVREGWLVGLIGAGARAGFVGGIADWFAVTALFRHPLGLPIPHTAILVRQQARLAEATGRFVASQFFDEAEVTRALESAQLPGRLAGWLGHDAFRATCSAAIRGALPGLLDRVEDGTAASAIRRGFEMLVAGKATGPLLIRILRSLVRDDLHQEVVSFLLLRLKNAIQEKEDHLRRFIQRRVTEQGGKVVGWMIGPSVAQKVITSLYNELEGIDPADPQMRENITEWLRREIDLLENDAPRRAHLEESLLRLIRHDSVLSWSGQIWHRLRSRIEDDSEADDGVTAQFIDSILLSTSHHLKSDPATAQKVDATIRAIILRVLPAIRAQLAQYIASVMSKWDSQSLTNRLQERIGKDLQYIRVNGTLVGFIIGAMLEAASRFFRMAMH